MKLSFQIYGIAISAIEFFLCRINQAASFTLYPHYRSFIPEKYPLPSLTVFTLDHNIWPYIIPTLLLGVVLYSFFGKGSERTLLHAVGINAMVFLFLCVAAIIAYAMPLIGFLGGV